MNTLKEPKKYKPCRLEEHVHQVVRRIAFEADTSMSKIIEDALKNYHPPRPPKPSNPPESF